MKTDEEKVRVYNYWRSEYSELLDRTNDRIKEIESLKQQLADANELIEFCLSETVMHSCDKDKLREYKEKYRVGA